jgi:simple sugar transport system permease protein
MSEKMTPNSTKAAEGTASARSEEDRWQQALKEIAAGGFTRTILSVFLGFLIGGIFMAAFNEDVIKTFSYFGSRPTDALGAIWNTIAEGYGALFRGAIFNAEGRDTVAMFRPITETLRLSAPLIMAGLGVALAFRVGLFNIGGNGQLVLGLIGTTWISTRFDLPAGVHMVVAIVIAVVFAALWGGVVGLLKARTGAHEVIVTIMLNYVAVNFFTWLLREPSLLLEANGGGTPKSDPPADTAMLPQILGSEYKLHIGFLLAIAATVVYWWLMDRSTIGFRFKMVGHNSFAARAAGINVERTYIWAMAASAAFLGLAGANQGLSEVGGITPSISAGIGFDAITVALLGGSRAGGVFAAGLLFGAFKAGSPAMQVMGVSPEILGVVQALIVLFIAAPPLIRALFRLPKPQTTDVVGDWFRKTFTASKKAAK